MKLYLSEEEKTNSFVAKGFSDCEKLMRIIPLSWDIYSNILITVCLKIKNYKDSDKLDYLKGAIVSIMNEYDNDGEIAAFAYRSRKTKDDTTETRLTNLISWIKNAFVIANALEIIDPDIYDLKTRIVVKPNSQRKIAFKEGDIVIDVKNDSCTELKTNVLNPNSRYCFNTLRLGGTYDINGRLYIDDQIPSLYLAEEDPIILIKDISKKD